MRRIFIVEPEDMVVPEGDILERIEAEGFYRPNFTTPQSERGESIPDVKKILATTLIDSLGSGGLAMTPIALLPASLQAALAIARPKIIEYLWKDQKEISAEAQALEAKELVQFLEKHAITLRIAKLAKFKFPPGHPQVGQTYLLHPLSDLPGSGKENVYIPHDVYDDLLLAERESELLKLLVELGATKVSIYKKQSSQASSKINAEVAGGSKVVGEAGVKVSDKSENEAASSDCRTFELAGKIWCKGDTLDRKRFAWVSYEPSWEALISAREIGGCLKAAIEIKDDASFASEREIVASLKFKGVSGKASGKTFRDQSEERVYMVKAEFIPVLNSRE